MQGQLEIVGSEKQVLKDTIISLEAQLHEARCLGSSADAVRERNEQLEEELALLQEQHQRLLCQAAETQALQDGVADLRYQLEISQRHEAEAKVSAPLAGSSAAILAQLTTRVQAMASLMQA